MKKKEYNKYQRIYHAARYKRLRGLCISKLGGKCSKCSETNDLEFDHIDPKSKVYEVSRLLNLSLDLLWSELKKCQLLCKKHHKEKTLIDKGQISAKGSHGTLSAYRYCKCDLCRKVKSEYQLQYDLRRGKRRGARKPTNHGTVTMYGYHKCRCDICRIEHNIRQRDFYRQRIGGTRQ